MASHGGAVKEVMFEQIHVPVLVGRQRLHETGSLLARLDVPAPPQTGRLEHAVNAGGAGSHHVVVQHHEGQAPGAFQRKLLMKGNHGPFLPILQPVVARDQTVMLIGAAVAPFPVGVFAGRQFQPRQQGLDGDLALGLPVAEKIDDLVARVVWHPDPFHPTPSVFINFTCSSISSESTSFFRVSLASRAAIFRSSVPLELLLLRSRATAPFSNKS